MDATVEIAALRARYADVVTRRAWAEMPDLFEPACPITLDLRGRTLEVVGGAAIAEFIGAAIADFDFFVFSILNQTVELDAAEPDRAHGRMYICELRHEPASGAFSQAFGLYRDEVRRDPADGRWRFAARRYCSLGRFDGRAFTAFPLPTD